jgi:hypothetical protein
VAEEPVASSGCNIVSEGGGFTVYIIIPTWIPIDDVDSKTATFRNNIATTRSNWFFGHAVSIFDDGSEDFNVVKTSKTHSTDGTPERFEVADMTYWSVLTGDRNWWMSDLKALQDRFSILDDQCTPSVTVGHIWDSCGVTSFWGEVGGFDGTSATITAWVP